VIRAAAKAVIFAGVLLLLPFDFYLVAVPLWFIFIMRTSLRMPRMDRAGFFGVLGVLIAIGVTIPNRDMSKRFGPFPTKTTTLAELASQRIVFVPQDFKDIEIQLPTSSPTKGEILTAITNQTKLSARVFRCANGSTLLFGSYVGPIQLKSAMTPR
jgi:hypothetical protein